MSWEEPTPRGAGQRRIGVAAAVVAVVVLAALGIAALQRDGTPRALTVGPTEVDRGRSVGRDDGAFVPERLEPIDVTSERAGSGNLLPDAPDDLTIIAVTGSELLTLDTGSGDRRRIRVAPVDLSATLAVIGTSVVVGAGSDVVRLTDGEVRPVRIADEHLLVPTVDDRSVWVFSGRTPYAAGVATRVALDGGVLDRVDLPAVTLPLGGTGDHLVVSTPGGIASVDGTGGRVVAGGTALATDGDRLARLECSDGLSCAIVVGTLDDPDQVRTSLDAADLPGGFAGLPIGSFSPDGRWLAVPRYRTEGRSDIGRVLVTVLDVATGTEVFRAEGATAQRFGTPLAWSPDSRWLVFVSGRRLRAWPAGGEGTRDIADDVGAIEALAVR